MDRHREKYEEIKSWYAQRLPYLKEKEPVERLGQLAPLKDQMEDFKQERVTMRERAVKSLIQQGNRIRNAKYESEALPWAYEQPEALLALEAEVDELWEEMYVLSDEKQRHYFQSRVRLWEEDHRRQYDSLKRWYGEKVQFLHGQTQTVQCHEDIPRFRNDLVDFKQEKKRMEERHVAAFKDLGDKIRTAEYKSSYSPLYRENRRDMDMVTTVSSKRWKKAGKSNWKHPSPDTLLALEKEIDALWATLAGLEDGRRRFLTQEKVRLWEEEHKAKAGNLLAWCRRMGAYLRERPALELTEAEVEAEVSRFEDYKQEKAST